MGYDTDFTGEFYLDRPLSPEMHAYLRAFNRTRRCYTTRNHLPDPLREAVELPAGEDMEFYVGDDDEGHMESICTRVHFNYQGTIIRYNISPKTQPGLWCGWTPNEDGSSIVWDGGEKCYDYISWIEYLITKILEQ